MTLNGVDVVIEKVVVLMNGLVSALSLCDLHHFFSLRKPSNNRKVTCAMAYKKIEPHLLKLRSNKYSSQMDTSRNFLKVNGETVDRLDDTEILGILEHRSWQKEMTVQGFEP